MRAYLVPDDQPLQQPLAVLVEDVRTDEREALPHQRPSLGLLLLHLEQHGEPHQLRLQLAQRGQTLRHAALEAGQGAVLGLGLRHDEGARVDRGRGRQGRLDRAGGPQQRQLACQRCRHPVSLGFFSVISDLTFKNILSNSSVMCPL